MASSKMAINSLLSGNSSASAPAPAPAAQSPHRSPTQSHVSARASNTPTRSAPSPPPPTAPPSQPSNSDPAFATSAQPKHRGPKPKRREAPLIQRAITSPQHFNRSQPPTLPHSVVAQAQFQSSTSASTASTLGSANTISSAQSTPSGDYRSPLGYGPIAMSPPPHQSKGSTEKMDFLADLASMQTPQQGASQTSRNIRASVSHAHPRSPSMPSLSRRSSSMVAAADHPMTDAPTATLQPRTFDTSSLDPAELQAVSDLTKQLAENTFLYESHAKLIKLLHKGLMNHVAPSDDVENLHNPHEYSLLLELRQARAAMDSRFPVGEELWMEWILDECMLARNTDDRIAVMELCQKAVQDEVGSTKIWRLFGDWVWVLYSTAHDVTGVYESNSLEQHPIVGRILAKQRWTEDEKGLGRELLGLDLLVEQWKEAVKATEWHLEESHVVWDPYIEILTHELASKRPQEKIENVKALFRDRLRQPHAAWDDTFQRFSQFISHYDNANYESTMVSTNKEAVEAKTQYGLRHEYELRLQRAADAGDQDTEWAVMMEYLEWESTQLTKPKKPIYAFDLFIGLIERANLRFPTDAELWEDHVDFLTEHPLPRYSLLQVARNATRHCPWSGNLWSKRLVTLEAAGNAFNEIEDVKHHATSSGLLEGAGGVDELVKVCAAWCGFLRRRAFAAEAGEDDRDVAEVGIRSELEIVKAIGEKKYGEDYKGDAGFRMQRIYIKFLSQAGRYDEVRSLWLQLSATYGDQWEFWDGFYMWEMLIWSRDSGSSINPEHATAALQQAIRQPHLDWPERLIESYLHHCRQHESAQRLQEAQVETRKALKQVAKRRAKEAAETAAMNAAAVQQHAATATAEDREEVGSSGKRKRKESNASQPEASAKRNRPDGDTEMQAPFGDASSTETSQLKRDRENTTVTVKHLPADVTESAVRQFFRDCGKIINLQLIPGDSSNDSTANIEFESKEDVLTAQTKDLKRFHGHSIEIQVGTGTTLFVANYPPEADEAYIRQLFSSFGEIVEVRFPSLKFDTHRRFCYVQFATSKQAKAATKLDGKALRQNLSLVAKVSNPAAKKDRAGAVEEGREIYIGNLHFKASEEEIRALFDEYGTVERVRIPRNMDGRSKGTAFVVFATKEEANAALEMNLKDFKGRILTVEISIPNPKGAKRHARTIINPASPASDATSQDQIMPDAATNGSIGAASPDGGVGAGEKGAMDYRTRTLTLRNVPDTVNVARIQALAEPFGQLRQVSIQPQRGEALIEFVDVKDVGRAEMSLNGYKIDKDVTLEVVTGGSGREAGGAERSGADENVIKGKKKMGGSFAPLTIRRPGLGFHGPGRIGTGGARGKGIGVGSKEAAANGDKDGTSSKDEGGDQNSIDGARKADNGPPTKPKSNADFRAFLGGN